MLYIAFDHIGRRILARWSCSIDAEGNNTFASGLPPVSDRHSERVINDLRMVNSLASVSPFDRTSNMARGSFRFRHGMDTIKGFGHCDAQPEGKNGVAIISKSSLIGRKFAKVRMRFFFI